MQRKLLIVASCLAVSLAFLPVSRASAAGLINRLIPARPASVATKTASQDSAAPQPVCCPQPCIAYHHKGPKLCCGDCRPPVETVLMVKDPCSCCEVAVPVCLPACCTGEPTLCCGKGFLGRDIVEYEWCCGYRVRVAFKHCGDLLVTTWGR